MKIKKFIAASMPEAMKTVRNELGNDAVILNSRVVFTGGFLGLFRKKNIEVIAAIDHNAAREPKPVLREKVTPPIQQREKRNDSLKKVTGRNSEANKNGITPGQSEDILKEIASLKEFIQNQSSEAIQSYTLYPEPIQTIEVLMNEQELSSSLKKKMTAALMDKWFREGSKITGGEMLACFEDEMVKFLSEKPCGGITFKKKYVTVVGPTGVGKTTTLAKLAADCLLNHQKKVAFITTDTYRIAAIEQLKTYAQILNVPLEVCYNPAEFQAAKEKFASYDVILIDTAGRNFRNKHNVADLRKLLDFDTESEIYLVLALTAKQKDMEDIFQAFSALPIRQFIFTKADETSVYGAMINLMEQFDIGVAYITTGQNVPDDVEMGSPGNIAKLLVGAK